MPAPESSWRIKSRPCPFYSQGKCLFQDSCNFLHDVKVISHRQKSFRPSPVDVHDHNINMSTTPTSAALLSATSFLRSPSKRSRSPRMYGLLMALQDVIGSSSDEEEVEQERTISNITSSSAEELDAFDSQTLVSTASAILRNMSPYSDDSGHASTAEDDLNDLRVFRSDDYHSDDNDQPTVKLPVSGISQPPPKVETQPKLPHVSEFEHHPEVNRKSLLSPVSLSLSPTSKVTLPAFNREDSVDSGYAECEPWSGPESLAKSPPSKAHRVSFLVESSSQGLQSLEGELRGSKTWVRVFENGEVDPSGIMLQLDEDAKEEMVTNFVVGDEDGDMDSSPTFLKSKISRQDEILPAAIALPLSPPSPPAPSPSDLEFPSFSEFVQASIAGTPTHILDDEEGEVDPHGIALPLSPDLSPSALLSFSQAVQSALPFLEDENDGASLSLGGTDPAAGSSFAIPVQDEQGPVTPTPTYHALPHVSSPSPRQKWGAVMNELSMLSLDIAPFEEKETMQGKERLFSVTPQVKDETLREVCVQEVTTSLVYSHHTKEDTSKENLAVSEPGSSTEESLSTPDTVLDFPLPPTNTGVSSSSSTHCVSTPPLARGLIVSTVSSSSSTPPASTGRVFTLPLTRGKAESSFSAPPDIAERVFTPSLVGARTTSDSPPYPSGSSSASSSTPPAPTSALPLARGGKDTIRPGPHQSQRAMLSSSLRINPSTSLSTGKGKGKAPMKDVDKSHEWDEAMEAGNVSTKVPFGFRYPYSLSGNPSTPLFTTFREREQSLPRSKPKPRVTTDLNSARPISPHAPSYLKDRADSARPSSPSPSPSSSTGTRGTGLRLLRLSSGLDPRPSSVSSSSLSHLSNHNDSILNLSMPQSPSVSSDHSLSNNALLSSERPSLIPQHIRNTLSSNKIAHHPPWDRTYPSNPFHSHSTTKNDDSRLPMSAPVSHSHSWRPPIPKHNRAGSHKLSHSHSHSRKDSSSFARSQNIPSGLTGRFDDDSAGEEDDENSFNETIRNGRPVTPYSAPIPHRASVMSSSMHAIATPPPTLLFAIASDDVKQVRRVLESGKAGPNDHAGPQSALAFTLTNEKLKNKVEIVKALLAFGADPSVLNKPELNPPQRPGSSLSNHSGTDDVLAPQSTLLEGMDPATRYYVARANAPSTRRTSQLIHRSFFRPLTRVRYDLIGQDCALEQLFRVLSMHSQQLSVAPIVVLLCGPSGHGKSLLARKFGSLLDVPTHTVNMTTLRSTHDLWQSYSMSPYEEPSNHTLAQFLLNNEGKRCVVVLDEIEKTEDEKSLWSLLMPWELGRCSPEAGKRHIDVRNVIWLATSNIGHDLVFDYNESRSNPEAPTAREEYVELMGLLRPRVSARLGASLLSRVTTVLPFVPFSQDEKMAITAEALYSLAGEEVRSLSPHDVESMVARALPNYLPAEGARSLYRAVSNQLVDCI